MSRLKNYDDEIKNIINQFPHNWLKVLRSKGLRGKSKDRTYLINYIYDMTSQMRDTNYEYKLKTLIYWVINEIESWEDERVRCKWCGKPIKDWDIGSLVDEYKQTCCNDCERALAYKTCEETMMKEHGVKNAFQIPEVKRNLTERQAEIQLKRDATRKINFPGPGWNLSKSLETRHQKYGGPVNLSATYQTKILRYDNAKWNNQDKAAETKRKNNTFNTSKPEEETYILLCDKFGKDDILRQYKSKDYPFRCDFFIKHLDLLVECNYSWVHGGHPFDPSSREDIEKVEKWKSKCSKYYDNAIYTWTVRDINKLRIAKEKRANLKVVWTLDEAKSLIEQLQ